MAGEDRKVVPRRTGLAGVSKHTTLCRSLGEKRLLGRPLPPPPSASRIFQTFPRQVIHPLLMDQYPESVNYRNKHSVIRTLQAVWREGRVCGRLAEPFIFAGVRAAQPAAQSAYHMHSPASQFSAGRPMRYGGGGSIQTPPHPNPGDPAGQSTQDRGGQASKGAGRTHRHAHKDPRPVCGLCSW